MTVGYRLCTLNEFINATDYNSGHTNIIIIAIYFVCAAEPTSPTYQKKRNLVSETLNNLEGRIAQYKAIPSNATSDVDGRIGTQSLPWQRGRPCKAQILGDPTR